MLFQIYYENMGQNICALFKNGHCIESDFLSYWSHGKVVCKRSQILVGHQIYNPDVSSNQHIQCTIFQLLVLTLMCKLILLTHNILRRTMRQVVSFKGLTLLWVTSKVSLCFFPARSTLYGQTWKRTKFSEASIGVISNPQIVIGDFLFQTDIFGHNFLKKFAIYVPKTTGKEGGRLEISSNFEGTCFLCHRTLTNICLNLSKFYNNWKLFILPCSCQNDLGHYFCAFSKSAP